MKKILFIISSDLFIRNYIKTGVIDFLSKNYDLKIACYKNIHLKSEIDKLDNFIGFYTSNIRQDKRRYFLMDVTLWRYRKRSTTFNFRFMRVSKLSNLDFFSSLKNIKEFLSFLKEKLKFQNLNRKNLILRIIFGNRFIFPIFSILYKKRLAINKSLEVIIRKQEPDLVVFPSSAYDPIGYDIIEIGKRNKVKTLFLIDNWDNLSSKTVFLRRPDFLTVWGKQSVEHAIEIHGFKKREVIPIGTPRFDIYYQFVRTPPKSPIERDYILFTGAALTMDETQALKKLDEEIKENPEIYGNLKIIYRPHPWRHEYNDFNESEFKNVVLDPQIREHYLAKQQVDLSGLGRYDKIKFQPDINYYPAILGNALFIIAPLTTMALEALIMEKNVLVLVYDDGKNITTPSNVFNYYEHFRGIEKLEGFTFCKDINKLKYLFRVLYMKLKEKNFKNTKSNLSYFLFKDNRTYENRLLDAIEYVYNSK